eukprot:m.77062 g.77062  ORF g.77062 m.77062 type:complete len:425 (+) comp14535_c0_seq3:79-1353(+)
MADADTNADPPAAPATTMQSRADMLAKARARQQQKKKKAGGGGVRASDGPRSGRSSRGLVRKISTDALEATADAARSLAAASTRRESIDADATQEAAVVDKRTSKFEQDMLDQGFDDYTPGAAEGGGLRFDPASVTPLTGQTAGTMTTKPATSTTAGNPLFFDNLEDFVTKPAPQGTVIQCRITRDKTGIDKGMYPTYILKLERPEDGVVKQVFLLAGRKRKKSASSNYLISTNPQDLHRESESFVAKLRSNFVGTHFTVFDNGVNPSKAASQQDRDHPRQELAAVIYETNLLGFKGPRKMTVIIPRVDEDQQRIPVSPRNEKETLLKRHEATNGADKELLVLGNKEPQWNEETGSYVLNFYGRVKMASVKNFQIVHKSDLDYIVMQFGRVDQQAFTMDYQYPMSAVQAFALALSSFDSKLACE